MTPFFTVTSSRLQMKSLLSSFSEANSLKLKAIAAKARSLADAIVGFVNSSKHMLLPSSVPPLPYSYHTATVLAFVRSSEVHRAQDIIHTWRQDCPRCSVVVDVVLISLDLSFDEELFGNDKIDATKFWKRQKFVSADMQYRYALLCLRRYLHTSSVTGDVVVILMGMTALVAMYPPGPERGEMTFVTYSPDL